MKCAFFHVQSGKFYTDLVCDKYQVVIESFLLFGQILDSVCVFSRKQKKTVLSRKCSAISYNNPHQKFYLSRHLYGHKVFNHRSFLGQQYGRSYHSDCNTKVSALVCRAISYNEQSALIDCYYPPAYCHHPS